MEFIKFSVLMSTYMNDSAQDLYKAIDSILMQTLPPDEIVIIVDGWIPDENNRILNDYCEKHPIIHVHRSSKNRGLGLSLKEGLGLCTYDLVARMDADDICVNDRFEKQIRFLQDHPEYDLLGSQLCKYINGESKKNNTLCSY